MAESCPLTKNITISSSSYDKESDLSKQDCTSPSPTETICLENLCNDSIPGKFNCISSLFAFACLPLKTYLIVSFIQTKNNSLFVIFDYTMNFMQCL